MKHIIVSKVNIPRNLDSFNHVRPAPWRDYDWNEKRIELLNKYTRTSLRKQSCQHFTFVTLWGEQHRIDFENKLPNEICLLVRRGIDPIDEKTFPFKAFNEGKILNKTTEDYYYQIRNLLRSHFKAPLLITDLDSDDCLRFNFCSVLQQKANKHLDQGQDMLLDVSKRYLMHVETGGTGQKQRSSPSPIVSSLELERVEAWCMKHPHSLLLRFIPPDVRYLEVPGLEAMQTVGDSNILTQGVGEKITFNPSKFV